MNDKIIDVISTTNFLTESELSDIIGALIDQCVDVLSMDKETVLQTITTRAYEECVEK